MSLQVKPDQLYLYIITNLLNAKKYVGITNNPKIRWYNHRNSNRRYAISNAIRKYGAENFEFKVICVGLKTEILKLEQTTIKLLDTKAPNGYNLTEGGEGTWGRTVSKEERENLRKIHLGTKASDMTRAKLSQLHKGRVFSDETRYKLHLAAIKRYESLQEREASRLINLGRKKSEATIKKLRQSLPKGGLHPSAKPILIAGMAYDCIKDAMLVLNVSRTTIYRRLKTGEYTYIEKENSHGKKES